MSTGNSWRIELRELNAAAPGVAAFRRVAGDSEAVWLDSSLQSSAHYARTFSILCPAGGPLSTVVSVQVAGGSSLSPDANSFHFHSSNPLSEQLETALSAADSASSASPTVFDLLQLGLDLVDVSAEQGANPSGFNLGWVGAFGYELKHHVDGVRQSPTAVCTPHRSVHPDALLMLADRALITDHAERKTYLLVLTSDDPAHSAIAAAQSAWLDWAEDVVQELAAQPESAAAPTEPVQREPGTEPEPELTFHADHSHADYVDAVLQAQAHIADGDSYEVCLTTTVEGPALPDPFTVYQRMRQTSPVPYGAYIHLAGIHVSSASPERFFQVDEQGRVSAKPIKGTRARSEDAGEDERWRRELGESSKDRAENLMIVDLLRNDLSAVAVPGSVRVPKLFAVESYSHVHQLVSTVEATLAPGHTAVDVLRVAFPGGSMTGAPKIRTMELIEQLEHRARGLYSGSIGWFAFGGAADQSITIRTVVSDSERSTFGVGGAIVVDSTPEGEWEEVQVKSRALLQALRGRWQQH